jgi:UDP-N-acetylmuramyl pentapeptide phosphotransferase/UDP-N-acetylglucosamine-1-phosphate transferase
VNDVIFLILLGVLAAILSWVGVRLIRRYAIQRRQTVEPESAASEPPRGGGLAILVVVLAIFMPAGLSLTDPSQVVRFALSGILMAMIGFVDDLRTLARPARLLTQAAVALIFVPAAPVGSVGLPGYTLTLSEPVSYLVSVLWIVGLTNAYSYMDGIDGLAGGQAVLAGGLWAGVGLVENNPLIVLLGLLIAGASAGFLVYNLPPASIFMGDVGSMFLGFSLAALPMMVVSRGASPRLMVSGGLIVGLFLFDAVFTFFRYLVTGQDRRHPYRSHLYQRLVLLGEPPHLVTLLYLLLSIGFGVAGLIYWREETWLALLMCALACLILYAWIKYREAATHPSPSTPSQ